MTQGLLSPLDKLKSSSLLCALWTLSLIANAGHDETEMGGPELESTALLWLIGKESYATRQAAVPAAVALFWYSEEPFYFPFEESRDLNKSNWLFYITLSRLSEELGFQT